jgi:YesN/AraC family two-component response regulator
MKNLLIIDDEILILENLKFLLSPLVSQIFTAKNGLEGLETLTTMEIHCVICDISMPVMNGLEFIKSVRDRNDDVPIIFYSGYGSHEILMAVSKYGAFDFLRKPDFHELEIVVMRALLEGLERKQGIAKEPADFISEYQLLLEKIQKQHN